jgi:hypothetical protein
LRRFRFPILLAVLAFLATGCIRSDLTVNVNDDGSGTYSAIIAFNPKAIAQLSALSGDKSSSLGDDPCKEMRDSASQNKGDLPNGAKIEDYTDGDFCGIKITAPFAAGDNPSAEISKALGGMDTATEGVSGIGLESFSITKSGSGWQFEASPNGTDTATGSASTGSEAEMMKSFLQGASSIVRIKLPGRVVEADSNPDKIDGNGVLIWNLDLTGETRTLKAHTEAGDPIKNKTYTDAGKAIPAIKGAGGATSSSNNGDATSGGTSGGGGSSSKAPLIIGALVVVAAIVGFVLWRKSKGGATPPAASPPLGGMAAGFPAPAAPPSGDPTNAWVPAPAPTDASAASVGTATALAEPPGATPAAGQPQWDAARNAYILWDAGSSKWLQYDNAAGAWKPIE